MDSTQEERAVENPKAESNSHPKDSKTIEEAKVGSINLYDDKAASLLHGLKLSSCQPDATLAELELYQSNKSALTTIEQVPDGSQVYTISNKMMCSLCDCKFDSREQQKEHYKLDWHRFNLKQRLIGAEPVTMETFETMSGDISSISGSDSDSSESDNEDYLSPYSDQATMDKLQNKNQAANDEDEDDGNLKRKQRSRSYPKVFFTNSQGQLISVHRCVLHGKKNIPKSQSDLTYMAMELASKPKWAIIMTGGGHFAGAVFQGNETVEHKTFHRYTVRAKRGTAQGMRDGQQGGKQPKSAGASLRRYNEAALMQDIQDLLESWKDTLKDCQLIFLRAPSYNRGIFYGGKNPAFKKDDGRISTIPFPTRRATLKELRRIHEVLSSVECYGDATEAETRLNGLFQGKQSSKSPSKASGDKKKADEKTTMSSQDYNEKQKTTGKKATDDNNGDIVEDEESGDDFDIELVYEEQEISTAYLKEFESTRKPRKKKKKQKPKLDDIDFGENQQLINDLYTVCKTGNMTKLESLLDGIVQQTSPSKPLTDDDQTPVTSDSNSDGHVLAKSSDNISSEHSQLVEEEFRTKAIISESHNSSKAGVCPESNQSEEGSEVEKGCSKVTEMGPMSLTSILNIAIDVKGTALLHVAAEACQGKVLWKLLESGADPNVKNKKGQPAYAVAANKEARNVFRRFMAEFPDKYDYVTAQVPSPLTADMEEERSNKAAEKKKAQRKAKRAKQKGQKEEQKKKMAEEKEKAWFAGLSDREKRALAAETRLAKQVTTSETNRLRCWLCGEDMTGKVPFEYLDFRFCTMKCLKQHKQNQSLPQS